MFRPKRSSLIVRRLLNASLINQSEGDVPRHLIPAPPIGELHDVVPTAGYDWLDPSDPSRDQIPTLWAATEALLKLIPDSDLEELVGMVEESRQNGGQASVKSVRQCVRLSRRQIGRRRTISFFHPRLPQTIISLGAEELICAHWRWPDIIDLTILSSRHDNKNVKLKCNFYCTPPPSPDQDLSDLCLNPFHWSRECVIDYPPPPYTSSASSCPPPPLSCDQKLGLDHGDDDCCMDRGLVSSTETGATLQGVGSCVPRHLKSPHAPFKTSPHLDYPVQPWCSLACWSYRGRVGPQITINQSRYHLHPHLLFPTPADPSPHPPSGEIVLTLSHGDAPPNVVYLYNEMGGPVFVDGPQRPPASSSSSSTPQIRVAPSHCVRLYPSAPAPSDDHDKLIPSIRSRVATVIRISVGKGWGPGYSRQIVESCPKWIELTLFLSPNR